MQDAPLARIDETDQALFFTATKTTPSDRALAPHLAVITAQLSGTFLRGPHPGIVCYRRNFFHVRGTIVFQSTTKSLLAATPRGDSRHIHISASLSAVESTNGDQVAIIALRRGAQEASTSYEDFLDLGTLESLIEPAGAPPDLSAVQLGHDDRSPGLLSSLNLTNAEYLEWVDSGDFISPTFTPQDFLPSTDSNAELLSTISFHSADFTDARTDHQHDDLFQDDTSEESYSYTYIPLAMDDRTPPVQAVYVGAQLVFYEANTDCHPATAWCSP